MKCTVSQMLFSIADYGCNLKAINDVTDTCSQGIRSYTIWVLADVCYRSQWPIREGEGRKPVGAFCLLCDRISNLNL